MKAIVLTFDRLALRMLGCYGNGWIDTPHFDRFAAEGVVFDCCLGDWFGADESAGDRSPHAWFTGRQACRSSQGDSPLPVALGELLRREGLASRLIVEAGADRPAWENAGFEDVVTVEGEDGLEVADDETPFAQLVAAAAGCLDDWAEHGVENGLLWLKSRGIPRPWTPPREFAAEYVGLFEDEAEDDEPDLPADVADTPAGNEMLRGDAPDIDDDARDPDANEAAEFTEEDANDDDLAADLEEEAAEFDQLLEALGRAAQGDPHRLTPGDWKLARAVYAGYLSLIDVWFGELREVVADMGEDVLWIITAAEGDALGERVGLPVPNHLRRGESREQAEIADVEFPLAEERIHLPLIVHLPGDQGGSRRQDLVQTADLMPTLCDFFGIDYRTLDLDGHSLAPTIIRNEPVPRDAAFLAEDGHQAIRTADYLCLRATAAPQAAGARARLYLQPDDPWGIHDVAAQSPAIVEELETRLNGFFGG